MATDEPRAEQERPCRVCGRCKPPASFVSGSSGRVRRHRVCRECRSQVQRAYRDAHPEQRERFNRWRRDLHRPQGAGSPERGQLEATGDRNEEAEHGQSPSTHQAG